MSKKIALCLSGLVGGTKGPDGKGDMVDVDIISQQYKKHIIDINDVDVFIHSWSVKAEDKLIEAYQPKGKLFEKQIDFRNINSNRHKNNEASHRFYSRFNSIQKSVKLKRKYEIDNDFEYDIVMISRLDLLWFSDINFDRMDKKYFHVSNWNHNGGGKKGPYDKRAQAGNGFLDFWFFSNSKVMDEFGSLYDRLEENGDDFEKLGQKKGNGTYRLSGHVATKRFADLLNLNTKRTMYRGYDHEVYRRYNRFCGEKIEIK